MSLHPLLNPKPRQRIQASSESFLKSINRLASRDSFSPVEEIKPRKNKHINRGSPIKVCTKCKAPLVAGENVTQYRYDRLYFLCAGCFSLLHKSQNRKRTKSKDPEVLLHRKKVSLQKRITKLMDQLAYINAIGIK